MFDFSKRLEDFTAGKPVGGKVRSKYDRGTKYQGQNTKYKGQGTKDKGPLLRGSYAGQAESTKYQGQNTGSDASLSRGDGRRPGGFHDQGSKTGTPAPKKYGAFGSSYTGAHSASRTSSGGGYPSARPSAGGRPSAPAGRGGAYRPSYSGGRGTSSYGAPRGRMAGGRGGRRLPPQPSYKQYMFTPTDESGELKHAPFESTKTFHDFAFSPILLRNIEKKGYLKPTEIQEKTFQAILDGRDMLALANTGSGKTAAFLLPIIHRMATGVKKRLLVMVPTRELALQVQAEFQWIAQGTFLRSTSVVGGASAYFQIRDIKHGVHCIVATPGRLKDLYDRKVIDFSTYGHIVLDEFDRMLDMGFIDDIRKIIALLPADRQTMMFSATMDASIEKHVHSFLTNPEKVTIKSEPVGSRVAQEVIFFTTTVNKREKLIELLKKDKEGKYLIFTRTKREADHLGDELRKLGAPADALHGDKSQSLRNRVVAKFRLDQIKILVATDVAARGLDIPDISHVINYDEPATREDYVHRIGRTARAGKQGTAYTFVKAGER